MSDKELYADLKRRADIIKSKISARNGERKVYIDNLKSKGFNSIGEVDAYIRKAQEEQEKKALIIKQKLKEYADAIAEAENALNGE